MKKVIVILASAYLFFLFLLYCGIFRNGKDPASVIQYYYDYIKNGEWFLTYQIYDPSCFNAGKMFDESLSRKLYQVKRIAKIDTLAIKGGHALFEVQLLYKNKDIRHSIVELEMIEGRWLIKDIKYL